MKWIENISQVLEYIEKNLEGTINLDELAEVANCSVGHIQKVFFYLTDMTLSEYIRQRKMTRAGFDLKQKIEKS
ncbi:TPA: hypothetical protein ACF3QW_001710 [Enterococcus faecium]